MLWILTRSWRFSLSGVALITLPWMMGLLLSFVKPTRPVNLIVITALIIAALLNLCQRILSTIQCSSFSWVETPPDCRRPVCRSGSGGSPCPPWRPGGPHSSSGGPCRSWWLFWWETLPQACRSIHWCTGDPLHHWFGPTRSRTEAGCDWQEGRKLGRGRGRGHCPPLPGHQQRWSCRREQRLEWAGWLSCRLFRLWGG